MMPNRLFEELAKAIGYALSDASDAGVASEEGIRKLVAAMGAMRGLASISAPFQEAYELAEWATDELEGEIDACANCKADGLPIHWSPVDSFGLDLVWRSVDVAVAEIIARRIGFSVDLDFCTFEILVGPSNCECAEPCHEAFDMRDTAELIGFLRDCEELALADCDNGPH